MYPTPLAAIKDFQVHLKEMHKWSIMPKINITLLHIKEVIYLCNNKKRHCIAHIHRLEVSQYGYNVHVLEPFCMIIWQMQVENFDEALLELFCTIQRIF